MTTTTRTDTPALQTADGGAPRAAAGAEGGQM